MSTTMTATQIADLHARRSAKGDGYAPTLAACLSAAFVGRLFDVDTASAGHDCLWIADDAETALAEVAAAVSPDDTAVPARWTAARVALDPAPRVWTITGTTGSLRFRCGPTRTANSLRAEVGDWQLFERDLGLDARAPDLSAAHGQTVAWTIADAPDDGAPVFHDFTAPR